MGLTPIKLSRGKKKVLLKNELETCIQTSVRRPLKAFFTEWEDSNESNFVKSAIEYAYLHILNFNNTQMQRVSLEKVKKNVNQTNISWFELLFKCIFR